MQIEREAEEDRLAAADKKRQRADGLWGDMRKRGGTVGGSAPASRPDKRARGGDVSFRTASGSVSAAGRADTERKGETMPGGSFPIRNRADLKNAKQSVGRAKNPEAARSWINKRARALGEPPLGG